MEIVPMHCEDYKLPFNLKCFHMKENLYYLILAVGNLCNFFVIKYKCVLGYPLDFNIIGDISNNQNISTWIDYYTRKWGIWH